MKNTIHLLLALFILSLNCSFAQSISKSSDHIEKVYIQTDKPLYLPGDVIWIKGWIVNGDNMPSMISQKAILTMIKPDGSPMITRDLKLTDGVVSTNINLATNCKGGIYQLKLKTAWLNEVDSTLEYTKEITIQNYDPPRLLMKLELDKESYGSGQSVLADFTAKDLKDRPIANVNTTFTLFVDGEEQQKVHIETNSDGIGMLQMKLPENITTPNVSINAKIEYRNQIESISKRVPIILENIDLQFLPEGGHLVAEASNILAFKAITDKGDPADISGEIFDEKGRKISNFKSMHDGMGKLQFTPKQGENYYAKICSPYESASSFRIPYPTSDKAKISVTTLSNEMVEVTVAGFIKNKTQLQLSKSNIVLWSKSIASNTNESKIQIPIDNLNRGIHKLTLRTEDVIQSERIVFLHPSRSLDITIEMNKSVFGLRDRVTAKITTLDHNGNPVPTDLGIAVVEDKMLSFADDKQGNLPTELLLSSELKGEIHEPNYYFDSLSTEKIEHLDLVMLTHGWRTHWENVTKADVKNYLMAQRTYFGQVCKRNEKNGIQTQVLVYDPKYDKVHIVETDKEGFFMLPFHSEKYFKLIAKQSNQTAYIKTWTFEELQKNKAKKAQKLINQWDQKPNYLTAAEITNHQPDTPSGFDEEFMMSLDEGVLMDAVEVVEYKVPLIEMDYTTTGSVVTAESIRSLPTKSINAIAGSTAGISATDGAAISIRGSRSDATVYYVDGVRVSGLIPQFEEEEEIILDSRYYGNKFRFNSRQPLAQKEIRLSSKRSQNAQFYVPKYEKTNVTVRSDFRKTIYWNPSIQTDKNGEAMVTFYTSDEVTSFSFIAEGITSNGKIGRKTEKIVAVKPLSIDCKLPSYFVLGDTAELSLVINNESNFDQHIFLNVACDALAIDYADLQSILVKSGKSISVPLHVIPKDVSEKSTLKISAKSDSDLDVLVKQIAVMSPYFPMQFSHSGVDTDTFKILLENPIQQSIQAQLNVYHPINSAMAGIESLFRRPSGCFEQVSSSTYPNVMVYQYLENNNSAQRENMAEAMRYIIDGYKKLAAYETPVGGFDWWGNAPGNVALTAYGLLEFTDMSKIYKGVDSEMIERTIEYLLDKRDGKGGFKVQKGSHAFRSVLYDVQNAYILYALSRQTIKSVDLSLEYETSKKHVLESKDLYKTSLMALTAYNMEFMDDYQKFMEIINTALQETLLSNITCQSSITRSGGNNKKIETLSLMALAMMKDQQSSKVTMSKIIDHIISSRRNGRFGSTQSTCLAIQAILTYSEWPPNTHLKQKATITATIDEQPSSIIEKELQLTGINKDTHHMIIDYSTSSSKTYEVSVDYLSKIPKSSSDPELGLTTQLLTPHCTLADQVSLYVELSNLKDKWAANPTLILGIPSGMSIQMKQLKELKKAGQFDYFEVFENKLVIYFNQMAPLATKSLLIDLKADIAGQYTAPPSCAYPYYDDQNTTWVKGVNASIQREKPLDEN
ncbi:MAG: alpha-2-macroglobulin family protein [Saprospiraceae bacterium]|nr:alpha-2-macroglobulin family protein [Saprospiraceae bacterium]